MAYLVVEVPREDKSGFWIFIAVTNWFIGDVLYYPKNDKDVRKMKMGKETRPQADWFRYVGAKVLGTFGNLLSPCVCCLQF